MMVNLSSLVALDFEIDITAGATSDDKVGMMTVFCVRWLGHMQQDQVYFFWDILPLPNRNKFGLL